MLALYYQPQAWRRGQRAMPPEFLTYLVVFRFEMWCPKQNTVARLKSKYWPQKSWDCYAAAATPTEEITSLPVIGVRGVGSGVWQPPPARKFSGQTLFPGQAQVASKILNDKKYIFSTVNSGYTLFLRATAKFLKNLEW